MCVELRKGRAQLRLRFKWLPRMCHSPDQLSRATHMSSACVQERDAIVGPACALEPQATNFIASFVPLCARELRHRHKHRDASTDGTCEASFSNHTNPS